MHDDGDGNDWLVVVVVESNRTHESEKKWKINGLQMSNFRKIELYTITRIKKGKIKERKQKQTECFFCGYKKELTE